MNKELSFRPKFFDELDGSNKELFHRCLKKFGKLEEDEMYAYKLAPCLGGKESIKNITKVNLFNNYSISKQLSEMNIVISDMENNTLTY